MPEDDKDEKATDTSAAADTPADDKADAKSDDKAEAKSDDKAEAKPDDKAKAKSDDKAETPSDGEAEAKADAKSDDSGDDASEDEALAKVDDDAELPAKTGKKKKKKRKPPGPDFGTKLPGGELPLVTDLLSTTITDLTDDLGTWAVGGLGYWLASIVVTFISIPLLYFVMFGGMFGGAAVGFGIGMVVGSEDLAVILSTLFMVLATFVATFGFIVVLTAFFMPMTGSMYRSIRSHQLGEEKLEIGAAFNTITVGIGSIVLAGFLAAAINMVGLMFFYVGVLATAAALHLMVPAVALHGVSPIKGAQMSFNHLVKHPGWSLGFWGIGFMIAMIGGYVPVLGTMVYFLFMTKGYRAAFGDGDEPYEWD